MADSNRLIKLKLDLFYKTFFMQQCRHATIIVIGELQKELEINYSKSCHVLLYVIYLRTIEIMMNRVYYYIIYDRKMLDNTEEI